MNPHEGHRSRLRERLRKDGHLEGFQPHEVLELLLTTVQPRCDTNPLAHELISTFGSLKGVLDATYDQLLMIRGMGEESAALISMLVPIFGVYEQCICEKEKVFKDYRDLMRFCTALMTGKREEHFCIICLSAGMRLLGRCFVSAGDLTETAVNPRTVAEIALCSNAWAVVLCHNHPGNQALPSMQDVSATRELRTMLRMLGVHLLDHIVIADGLAHSMVQLGDIPPDAMPLKDVKFPHSESAWQDGWL